MQGKIQMTDPVYTKVLAELKVMMAEQTDRVKIKKHRRMIRKVEVLDLKRLTPSQKALFSSALKRAFPQNIFTGFID